MHKCTSFIKSNRTTFDELSKNKMIGLIVEQKDFNTAQDVLDYIEHWKKQGATCITITEDTERYIDAYWFKQKQDEVIKAEYTNEE